MGLDDNYKRAMIRLANKELPEFAEELKELNRNLGTLQTVPISKLISAMDNLARQINLMPRSVRMRP